MGVVRVGAFVLVGLLAFATFVAGWFALVFATGGAATECNRQDCGTLGNFTFDTAPLVLIVWVVGALAVAWLVVRPRQRRSM